MAGALFARPLVTEAACAASLRISLLDEAARLNRSVRCRVNAILNEAPTGLLSLQVLVQIH